MWRPQRCNYALVSSVPVCRPQVFSQWLSLVMQQMHVGLNSLSAGALASCQILGGLVACLSAACTLACIACGNVGTASYKLS
jgi:hypothetical protein